MGEMEKFAKKRLFILNDLSAIVFSGICFYVSYRCLREARRLSKEISRHG